MGMNQTNDNEDGEKRKTCRRVAMPTVSFLLRRMPQRRKRSEDVYTIALVRRNNTRVRHASRNEPRE